MGVGIVWTGIRGGYVGWGGNKYSFRVCLCVTPEVPCRVSGLGVHNRVEHTAAYVTVAMTEQVTGMRQRDPTSIDPSSPDEW